MFQGIFRLLFNFVWLFVPKSGNHRELWLEWQKKKNTLGNEKTGNKSLCSNVLIGINACKRLGYYCIDFLFPVFSCPQCFLRDKAPKAPRKKHWGHEKLETKSMCSASQLLMFLYFSINHELDATLDRTKTPKLHDEFLTSHRRVFFETPGPRKRAFFSSCRGNF